MTVKEQERFMELFHSGCLAIMRAKNPDYAPDGIPLLDLMLTAAESNQTIEQALWPTLKKHISAIRKHYFLGMPLTSESIITRLQDSANYHAILAFYTTNKHDLHRVWKTYWTKQRCECEYAPGLKRRRISMLDCDKHLALSWLEKQTFALGSDPDMSRSTRKARA